jgi:hypothetical protein
MKNDYKQIFADRLICGGKAISLPLFIYIPNSVPKTKRMKHIYRHMRNYLRFRQLDETCVIYSCFPLITRQKLIHRYDTGTYHVIHFLAQKRKRQPKILNRTYPYIDFSSPGMWNNILYFKQHTKDGRPELSRNVDDFGTPYILYRAFEDDVFKNGGDDWIARWEKM